MCRIMPRIILLLVFFNSLLLSSCSKKNKTFDSCLSSTPVEDVKVNKGSDYVIYKLFKKKSGENFNNYVNTLESCDLLNGYSRVEFSYRIELLDNPKSILYKSKEIERISYINFNSKNRYILVNYPNYILVCIIRV